jgi:hypothetical protein
MTTVEIESTRVPVEHRWWGLDRRSVPYAAVGLAVLALWAWVMPWVAAQVPWDDPVVAGESFQVTDDVTMTGQPGWAVVSGLRTTDDTRSGQTADQQLVLVKNGVALSILQGPFSEAPQDLLAQAEKITGTGGNGYHVAGTVRDVTTASGLRGVAQDFSTTQGTGTVTAFVVDEVGVEIQVSGPRAQVAQVSDEVAAMIDSLATDGSDR